MLQGRQADMIASLTITGCSVVSDGLMESCNPWLHFQQVRHRLVPIQLDLVMIQQDMSIMICRCHRLRQDSLEAAFVGKEDAQGVEPEAAGALPEALCGGDAYHVVAVAIRLPPFGEPVAAGPALEGRHLRRKEAARWIMSNQFTSANAKTKNNAIAPAHRF